MLKKFSVFSYAKTDPKLTKENNKILQIQFAEHLHNDMWI
jgi:hypothetical protein